MIRTLLGKRFARSKYFKNTSMVTVARIIESLLSYVIIVLITRSLGAEGLGAYSFVFAFAAVFFIFTDFGLLAVMITDISRDISKSEKYVSNILTVKLLLSTLSILVYFIIVFFYPLGQSPTIFVVVGLVELAKTIQSIPLSYLRVVDRADYLSIIDVSERIIAFIGALIVLPNSSSILPFVSILLFSSIAKLILSFMFGFKNLRYSFGFDFAFLWDLMKRGLPFMFFSVFSVIYVQIDTIFLNFMYTDQITGWYNAGYRIINIFNFIPLLLLTFGFPYFSRYYKSDKAKLRTLFEQLMHICIVVMVPIVFASFIVTEKLMQFIYGFSNEQPVVSFQILAIASVFIVLGYIMLVLLGSVNKQLMSAKIAGLGALINICLNVLLIPRYSLYGAGISTLVTYVVMYILFEVYIKKNFFNYVLYRYFAFPIIASLVMLAVLQLFLSHHIIVLVVIGALTYFAVLVLLYLLYGRIRTLRAKET